MMCSAWNIWRSIACALALAVIGTAGTAQEGLEYWFGSDPGAGSGTFISTPITSGSAAALSIPTSGLSVGVHDVGLRARSASGIWGFAEFVRLSVEGEEPGLALAGGEYFWNEEPGFGAGEALALDDLESGRIEVPTTELDYGLHTLGLRLHNAAGQWGVTTYTELEICTNFSVTAAFEMEISGTTVYFTSNATHQDETIWTLGGDSTRVDTMENLTQTLIPGTYVMEQRVENECDTTTTSDSLVVFGPRELFPARAAHGATATYEILGGFGEVDSITLSNGSLTFTPDILELTDEHILFEFTAPEFAAGASGFYELCTYAPEEPATCLSEALEIDVEELDYSSWIEGQAWIRRDVWTPFTVWVENTGNSNVYGVPVAIICSGDADARIDFDYGTAEDEAFASDPANITDLFTEQLLSNHVVRVYNEVSGDSVYFGMGLIPMLQAGERLGIQIEVKAYDDGMEFDPVGISSRLSAPWYTQSQIENMTYARSACDFMPPCVEIIYDILGTVPLVSCVTSSFDMGCTIGECISAAFGGVGDCNALDFMTLAYGIANCEVGDLNTGKDAAKFLAGYFFGVGMALDGALGNLDPNNCDGCVPSDDCGGDDSNPEIVVSIDPNEKYGPVGWGSGHWLATDDTRMHYRITCENADSASAPAAAVYIYDTLDLALFDPTTLVFDSWGFGDTLLSVLEDDGRFVHELDLRPDKDAILRVIGEVDTITGVVNFSFESLDPATGSLTFDVWSGFLNPNVTAPEGEAEVSFTVQLQPAAQAHGVVIENIADIIFDGNEAIQTPLWSNGLDALEPSSSVVGASAASDSTIQVVFEGLDDHSGVRYHRLYTHGGDSAVFIGTYSGRDTVEVSLDPEADWYFIAQGIDGVGNIEEVDFTLSQSALSEWHFTPQLCVADFNGDQLIGVPDLLHILTVMETSNDLATDLDGNGITGIGDLLSFLQLFGTSCL